MLKCYVCYDEQLQIANNLATELNKKSLKDKIICSNNHFICDGCFIQLVENQLKDDNYYNFKKYGSRITCNYDTCHFKFSRKILEPKLKKLGRTDLWIKFNKQLDSTNNEKYKNNPLVKFFHGMFETVENIVKSNNKFDAEYHKNKIIEEILNNRCPKCKTVFYDFTDCFAVECSNCGCHFCGWCLIGFKNGNECHRHVINCNFSLEKGNLFSTTLNFKIARNDIIAKKITCYLNKLNFYDGIEVYSKLSNNFKSLHLYNKPIKEDTFNIISDKIKLTDDYYRNNKDINNILDAINLNASSMLLILGYTFLSLLLFFWVFWL